MERTDHIGGEIQVDNVSERDELNLPKVPRYNWATHEFHE